MNQPVDYSRRVQAETEEYIRELLDQTQRLRAVASSLQAEKESLWQELSLSARRARQAPEEEETLQHRLAEIARANQESLDRYQAVVMQNASISYLYVATYRLHGSIDRDSVLLAIQEVAANLIGCEEIASSFPTPTARVWYPSPPCRSIATRWRRWGSARDPSAAPPRASRST